MGGIILSLVLIVIYTIGYRRLSRLGDRSVIRPLHAVAFSGALAALVIAFSSPLEPVAESVFSVHVLQHLVLFSVAAPLLTRSRIVLGLLWGLPIPLRRRIARFWSFLSGVRVTNLLARPALAWLLFSLSFAYAQLSVLYGWIVGDAFTHALVHAGYLLVSCIFWWGIFAPHGQRKLGYRHAVAYVAMTFAISSILGAALVYLPAPEPAQSVRGVLEQFPGPRGRVFAAGLIILASAVISLITLSWLAARSPRRPLQS